MISVLGRPEEHELYFNNFFASYNLLEKLSGRMIRATGTMRNSRTRKIPRMPVDEVKKKHRGFFDHVCNGTVNVVDGTTTPLSLWPRLRAKKQVEKKAIHKKLLRAIITFTNKPPDTTSNYLPKDDV
ncbi:PiggyBac transposable element-derived protein [Trichinella pseudospiralis]